MSLTGGVSFFNKSQCLFADGATAVASSNTSAQNYPLGTNKYFRWESAGSDDSTVETLTVTLPESKTVTRLFILGHNLKDFTVTTNDGSFTNVISLDDTGLSGISESGYEGNVSYYEFDGILLDDLTITMDTTQEADQQKYITQVILTDELGTLEGYPVINGVAINPNIVNNKTINGKSIIEKGEEVASFSMKLTSYPVEEDVNLLDSLFDRQSPFLVWLSGGKIDSFKIKQRGWKLNDVYQMQVTGTVVNGYKSNVYSLGVETQYKFQEVVF